MAIMPMIDAYAAGLDWPAADVLPRPGLWLFLVVTYLNGSLLEIGRKIRAPQDEREGVDTYSRAWGRRGGPVVWLAVLAATAAAAWGAARATSAGAGTAAILALLLIVTAPAAVGFLQSSTPAK